MGDRDLLQQLKGGSDEDFGDVPLLETDSKNSMKLLFSQIESINNDIAQIRRKLLTLEEKYSKTYVFLDLEQNTKLTQELEQIVTDINNSARETRTKIESLKDGDIGATAEEKMQANMKSAVIKKFVDVMKDFQLLQQKFKENSRQKITKQYKILCPNATQEEIDTAIESGDTNLFQQLVIQKTRVENAKIYLDFIEAKSASIKRLEQSITELYQLFMDMAVLVEHQSHIIDEIDHNVVVTLDNVKKGVGNLEVTVKHTKKSRKRLCIIIVIFIIILAILGGSALIGGLAGK